MAETIGRTAVLLTAILAGTYLVVNGDPEEAKAWGGLASAALTAAVLWQQRTASQRLDQATRQQDTLVTKVEEVHQEVNGKAAAQLAIAAEHAYARGVQDALGTLQPTIEKAAVAAFTEHPPKE